MVLFVPYKQRHLLYCFIFYLSYNIITGSDCFLQSQTAVAFFYYTNLINYSFTLIWRLRRDLLDKSIINRDEPCSAM